MQCAQQTGRGHALRLVQLAAIAQPLQGPVSIGSIMRAPSYAIDYHRSKPSPEPILHRATECIRFCEVRAAATTDPRRGALARMT